jgi:hypothetical protein
VPADPQRPDCAAELTEARPHLLTQECREFNDLQADGASCGNAVGAGVMAVSRHHEAAQGHHLRLPGVDSIKLSCKAALNSVA